MPLHLDPFDTEAAAANPMRFTAVCTDIVTGEAVYRDIERGDGDDLDWIRASASVPLLARPVELDGRELLDGGIADSIPAAWMVAQGYDKNVVILTQPEGFVKEPNRLMPLLERAYGAYPKLVELLANRHVVCYNAQLEEVTRLERDGKALVIRPSESVKAPLAVQDPEVLERIYQVGRRDGEARIADVRRYLAYPTAPVDWRYVLRQMRKVCATKSARMKRRRGAYTGVRRHSRLRWSVPHETPEGVEMVPRRSHQKRTNETASRRVHWCTAAFEAQMERAA